jgi:predicted phosphohydrolase
MDIFAISDLHLGPGQDKGHYSSKWKGHQTIIRKHWDERIPADALVLMPGDFSWFQDPDDLIYDYYWIHDRPGQKKILSPGNHDYGVWTSQKQVRDFCQRYDSLVPVMGDAIRIPNPYGDDKPGIVIATACGTQSPEDKYFDSNTGASSKQQDPEAKRFVRELARLRAALHSANSLQVAGDHLVVMIHYPPFANGSSSGPFSDLIEEAGAELCVYGHLHQEGQWLSTFQGARGGCEYRFVGTDFLGFAPTRIGSFDEGGLHLDAIERRAHLQWKTLSRPLRRANRLLLRVSRLLLRTQKLPRVLTIPRREKSPSITSEENASAWSALRQSTPTRRITTLPKDPSTAKENTERAQSNARRFVPKDTKSMECLPPSPALHASFPFSSGNRSIRPPGARCTGEVDIPSKIPANTQVMAKQRDSALLQRVRSTKVRKNTHKLHKAQQPQASIAKLPKRCRSYSINLPAVLLKVKLMRSPWMRKLKKPLPCKRASRQEAKI